MSAKVYLTGGGPGDTELLTVKAKRLLGEADVVVCDALVGEAVRALIPASARVIYVGKRAGAHTRTQEEIGEILLEEARRGHTVVRLHGGDPFLFGRGGEEAALLAAHGVPFEIVPGVTSALAVPAYGGIPVTRRGLSSSVHVFTAHRREGEELDYQTIAKLEGTLIFLMGATALPDVCKGLLDAGMDPETPAAVIHSGCTAAQRKVVSTLRALPEAAKGLSAPAVILVGPVCSLDLSWKRPLDGLRFLVTRPHARAAALCEGLRALGGEAVELPVTEQRLLPDAELLELWYSRWLVFTSPSGVDLFFELLKRRRVDVRRLVGIDIAALGQGTAKRLAVHGVFARLVPETYDAAALGDALAANLRPGERVFIARARGGNPALVERISRSPGVEITDRAIYETVPVAVSLNLSALLDERTYPVFTSASGVRAFAAAAGTKALSGVPALCIGAQTAAQAREFGIEPRVAREASDEALIELALTMGSSS